jgi:hypothetical protein
MFLRHRKHVHKHIKIGVINIIKNILENNNKIEKSIQKETIQILETIIEQNYFQFEHEYYKQTEGLATGAPTSSILAEAYIQHMEHTQICLILIEQQIIACFRYVNDISTIDQRWSRCWGRLRPSPTICIHTSMIY